MAEIVTDDQARVALFRINESAQLERRKTGTIVAVAGRRVSVLLDGEGTSIITAYRGIFEPSVGAGVTIERVVGTTQWKVVGIRDTALAVINDLPYDFEVRGDVLYYPVALEAINDTVYSLDSGLTITLYNTQYLGFDGFWRYHEQTAIDLLSYVPAEDSRWVIIYADTVVGTIRVYAHDVIETPEGQWPAAVNGLLINETAVLPLLAVQLDAGMSVWGDAWKIIKRGISFDGKRVLRIPFSTGTGDGGDVLRYHIAHADISANDAQMVLELSEINIELLLSRTGAGNPSIGLHTEIGTENYDWRAWWTDNTGAAGAANADNESVGITNEVMVSGITMGSNYNAHGLIRRVATGDVWKWELFISGAGARASLWAAPAGLYGFGGTQGWNATPPTNDDLDTAFGTAASVGAGFTGMIDDVGDVANLIYFVASDGTRWWYTPMRPAT